MNAKAKLFVYGLLLVCSILCIAISEPFVIFLFTNIALFIYFRAIMSNSGAAATSVTFSLLALGTAPLISQRVLFPLPLVADVIFLCMIIASGSLCLFRSKTGSVPPFTKAQIAVAIGTLAPSILTGLALWIGGNLAGKNLGWMLPGDAQTNTNAAIEIVSNNGSSGIFATLSQSTMAFFISGTLGTKALDTSFLPIMQVQSLVLFMLWALASVLFGLIASREFGASPLMLRAFIAFIAAFFPFSWFILGFSLQAGFYNSPVALICLASTWLIWRDFEIKLGKIDIFQLAPLLAATLLSAFAWTPLAIIPAALLAVAYIRYSMAFFKAKASFRRTFIALNLFLIIGITIFLSPILSQSIKSATADGFMTELPPQFVAVTFTIAVLVAVTAQGPLFGLGKPNSGLLIVTLSGAIGVLLLSLQAAGGAFMLSWAYYPRKAAWFIAFFVIFILAIELSRRMFLEGALPFHRKVLAALCLSALLLIGLRNVPYWTSGTLKFFPLLAVATTGQDKTGELEEISSALNMKQVRLAYGDNDFIVNQWVFQWLKFKNQPPVWTYAYSLIKSPHDVCSLASAWGGEVTLLTRDDEVMKQARQECGQLLAK